MPRSTGFCAIHIVISNANKASTCAALHTRNLSARNLQGGLLRPNVLCRYHLKAYSHQRKMSAEKEGSQKPLSQMLTSEDWSGEQAGSTVVQRPVLLQLQLLYVYCCVYNAQICKHTQHFFHTPQAYKTILSDADYKLQLKFTTSPTYFSLALSRSH